MVESSALVIGYAVPNSIIAICLGVFSKKSNLLRARLVLVGSQIDSLRLNVGSNNVRCAHIRDSTGSFFRLISFPENEELRLLITPEDQVAESSCIQDLKMHGIGVVHIKAPDHLLTPKPVPDHEMEMELVEENPSRDDVCMYLGRDVVMGVIWDNENGFKDTREAIELYRVISGLDMAINPAIREVVNHDDDGDKSPYDYIV